MSSIALRNSTSLLLAAALLVPWLNPVAAGPSPAVLPWLITLFCTLVLAMVWVVCRASRVAPDLRTLVVWTWFVAGLISCCIALLQYFGVSAELDPWVNSARLGEAYANLRQRNQLASLTNVALAALIWMTLNDSEAACAKAGWTRCVPILFAVVLLVTGNAASASRTGMLQLLMLCLLSVFWKNWRQRHVLVVLAAAVAVYTLAALLLPQLAGLDPSIYGMAARLLAGDEACASRTTLWSNVLHLIAQKPWFGWGWGELDYAHYITLYGGPRFCGILDNAHNLPLQLAVELGIPVAVVVCGGFVWWVLRQRPWRETDSTRQLAWSVMAVILLHSMLEYPLWYGPFQVAFGLCIGLLWQTGARSKSAVAGSRSIRSNPLPRLFQTLSAIVLIVVVSYAAWDYRRVSQIYLTPQERDAAYREDTLAKIQSSWLFADQVRFAQLLLTPLTRDNALWTFNTATELLHYSPEPRVIEKIIESAVMLGRNDEAVAHLARYRAAFPEDYARWTQANAKALSGLQFSK